MGKLLGMGDGGIDAISFVFSSNPSQCSISQKKLKQANIKPSTIRLVLKPEQLEN